MSTENNDAVLVDGGTPTEEEARLAAQLEGLGENPTEEPTDPPSDEEKAAAEKAAADAAAAEKAAADAAAAAAAASAPAAAAPAPAPAVAPVPKPEPPKDFDAEYKTLQQQFDDGEIDGAEFQKRNRELGGEEGRYNARVVIWEERQANAQAQADHAFQSAALSWEAANKDFMANPLRAGAMQTAVTHLEKTEPNLSPADLLQKASAIAFEAFGWKAAAQQESIDPNQAVKEAIAARTANPVPQTLGNAPAAAPIEANRNAAFSDLDSRDISSLEDTIARMSPEQLDQYLRDAPGANATGRPE